MGTLAHAEALKNYLVGSSRLQNITLFVGSTLTHKAVMESYECFKTAVSEALCVVGIAGLYLL